MWVFFTYFFSLLLRASSFLHNRQYKQKSLKNQIYKRLKVQIAIKKQTPFLQTGYTLQIYVEVVIFITKRGRQCRRVSSRAFFPSGHRTSGGL